MPRKVLILTPDGATPILNEVSAHDELQLQERLKANPDLIPIEEFGWTGPLMIVGRETPLASGSVDLIAVARSGEILIAEFKTGPQNPDFRQALAQVVDYGADVWGKSLEEFEAAVATRYFASTHCPPTSPTKGCTTLLQAAEKTWGAIWTEEERSAFADRVTSALRTGLFHFAVVAQRFNAAMQGTAEFLNATSTARFYLVELIRFSNGEFEAYEARTVSKPSPSKSTTASYRDMEAFLAAEQDDTRREGLREFLEFCFGAGLTIFWGTKGISIKVPTPDAAPPLSVAWVHPTGIVGWGGLRGVALGYDRNSAAQHPSIEERLRSYAEAALGLPGAQRATAKHLEAAIFDSSAEATNMATIKELLASIASIDGDSGTIGQAGV